MCSIKGFSTLPPVGHISLCEIDGKVKTVLPSQAEYSLPSVLKDHPNVKITPELLRTSLYREELKDVFVPVEETLFKRMFQIWYEKGFAEVLQFLAAPTRSDVPPVLQQVASFSLKVAQGVSQIHNSFYPFIRESGPKLIAAVAQTRDWDTCRIRCLAWHPHCTRLAVAAWDDSVRVFCSNSTRTLVVKCKNQRGISCLAWRPMSVSELAVGCEEGVYVWQLDPKSIVTHPSTNCAIILKHSGHSPVTSLAWSPQGDLLVTASAHDTNIRVWDVEMERSTPVRRMGGGGVCMVSWSPCGARVFTAMSSIVFRVWDTLKWDTQKWSVKSGRVQTASWSPCGTVLLFATTGEPYIYSLALAGVLGLNPFKSDTTPRMAIVAADLTPIDLENGERLGGLVHSMTWDPHGLFLAVIFKDCDVVAVFTTQISPRFNLSPRCLVQGLKGEVPNAMHFQQNFSDGAVLTIGWSSGRVQHFLIFSTDYDPLADAPCESTSTTTPKSRLRPLIHPCLMSNFKSPLRP